MSKKATAKEIEEFKNLLIQLNVFTGNKLEIEYADKSNEKIAKNTGGVLFGIGGGYAQYMRFAGKSGPKIMENLATSPGKTAGGIALIAVTGAVTALLGGSISEFVVAGRNRKSELENLIDYSKKLEKKLESDERENVKALLATVKRNRIELEEKI